jgi:hypothetical protein
MHVAVCVFKDRFSERLRRAEVGEVAQFSMSPDKPLDYAAFLVERRRFMAEKIRQWVEGL